MRTEEEIQKRIDNNKTRLRADRIARSLEITLIEENRVLEWVLGE